MKKTLIMLLLLIGTSAYADKYHDTLVEQAKKAIKNTKTPKWKIKGYNEVLKKNLKTYTCSQTIYTPHEGFARGQATRWGYGCSESTAASNYFRGHQFIWVVIKEKPDGTIVGQLRRIEDTGAKWNDGHWRRKILKDFGVYTTCWIDIWVENFGDYGFNNGVYPRKVVAVN